jgi:hypothetical protein
MASSWKENKQFYDAVNAPREAKSFFTTFPRPFEHIRGIVPNPEAMKDAHKAWPKRIFTATNLLSVAAIVWSANFLFMDSFSSTLIPITNNYVIDSLILTFIIGIIWVILRHRQEDYDDIAAEIEQNAREGRL